jgi:hypothetical protein
VAAAASGVRFAFYGRTSTADHQDPVSSRAWQVEIAKSVIAERGEVVVEFFDAGWSREVAWERRPRRSRFFVWSAGSGIVARMCRRRRWERIARLEKALSAPGRAWSVVVRGRGGGSGSLP